MTDLKLRKSRIALVLYGVGAGIAYSFIMDVWTVLGHYGTFSRDLYLAALGIDIAIYYLITPGWMNPRLF